MKPTRVGDTWARFDDDTTWAIPDDGYNDETRNSMQWELRYGSPMARELQRLSVASVLECYRALIALPQRERNARVKAIREAMAMRATGSGGGDG